MRTTQSTFSTSLYATPFVLDRDVTNRYKVDTSLVKTTCLPGAIPYLRTPETEWKKKQYSFNQVARRSSMPLMMKPLHTSNSRSMVTKTRKKQIKKEFGWNSYVKPISGYNEKVHASKRVGFEAI